MHAYTFLLAAAGCLIAADGKDDKAPAELKKFDGTWTMVSAEHNGAKVADEVVKKSKLTWKGPDCTVETPHQSKDPIKAKNVRIDPTKKPAEMDWVRDAGPDAGKTMYAIYEFIDVDQYRICYAPAGKERPKEFSTKAGSGHFMHVWKRAKN